MCTDVRLEHRGRANQQRGRQLRDPTRADAPAARVRGQRGHSQGSLSVQPVAGADLQRGRPDRQAAPLYPAERRHDVQGREHERVCQWLVRRGRGRHPFPRRVPADVGPPQCGPADHRSPVGVTPHLLQPQQLRRLRPGRGRAGVFPPDASARDREHPGSGYHGALLRPAQPDLGGRAERESAPVASEHGARRRHRPFPRGSQAQIHAGRLVGCRGQFQLRRQLGDVLPVPRQGVPGHDVFVRGPAHEFTGGHLHRRLGVRLVQRQREPRGAPQPRVGSPDPYEPELVVPARRHALPADCGQHARRGRGGQRIQRGQLRGVRHRMLHLEQDIAAAHGCGRRRRIGVQGALHRGRTGPSGRQLAVRVR